MDHELTPRRLDDLVDRYELDILKEAADWSVENGDLALTKDRDIRLGGVVYSALFRLVDRWRLNEPHLRALFDMANVMRSRAGAIDDEINQIGDQKRARFDIRTHLQPDAEFTAALHGALDAQHAAQHGHATFAGCVVIVISSILLRFKDDLDAGRDEWTLAGPNYGGRSLGDVVVASANGFRHGDEWAKTYPANSQQRVSQSVLEDALRGLPLGITLSAGRCPDIIALLSSGDFESLTANVLGFAHGVALRRKEQMDRRAG